MGEAGYTRQAARGSTCAHGSVGARLAVGLALWICGSYGPSSAAVAPVANAERGACHTAAAEMEARFDIPRQLLAALALAESGRWNAERRESFGNYNFALKLAPHHIIDCANGEQPTVVAVAATHRGGHQRKGRTVEVRPSAPKGNLVASEGARDRFNDAVILPIPASPSSVPCSLKEWRRT